VEDAADETWPLPTHALPRARGHGAAGVRSTRRGRAGAFAEQARSELARTLWRGDYQLLAISLPVGLLATLLPSLLDAAHAARARLLRAPVPHGLVAVEPGSPAMVEPVSVDVASAPGPDARPATGSLRLTSMGRRTSRSVGWEASSPTERSPASPARLVMT
jgi:hypothetical protein